MKSVVILRIVRRFVESMTESEMEKLIMMRVFRMLAATCLVTGFAMPVLALEERSEGDVRFITGGVGETEIAEIKAIASGYSLQVLTADRAGQFISGVHVTIQRGNKSILDIDLDGPFLLVKLAPGSYRLRATFQGRSVERSVAIAGKRQNIALHF